MEKSEDSGQVNWLNVPVIVGTKYPVHLQNLAHSKRISWPMRNIWGMYVTVKVE